MLISKFTGAAAPSEAAKALSQDYTVSAESLLHGLGAIDLVGSHRYDLWPAATQGARNTCIAFAVAACVELLRAGVAGAANKQSANFELLSPQFLYWFMRQIDPGSHPPPGWKDGATKLDHARQVLAKHGICELSLCPYEELAPDEPVEGPPPSKDAQDQAEARNLIKYGDYEDRPQPASRPGIARRVYDLLASGCPVAVAIPVFYIDATRSVTNWEDPPTAASGVVRDPDKDMIPSGADQPGHAVCIVGFQPDPNESTGGWFILRNSRGLNFAWYPDKDPNPPHVPAPGYGAISATYIEQYCWETLSPKI